MSTSSFRLSPQQAFALSIQAPASQCVVEVAEQVDPELLRTRLDSLVARHEILRTRFPAVDGVPMQSIAPPSELSLPVVDLTGLAATRGLRKRVEVSVPAGVAYLRVAPEVVQVIPPAGR